MIQVLKCKLNEVVVTRSDPKCNGSITIGGDLMKAANLHEYEVVEVNGKNRNSRIKTYIIKGQEGAIELNGGAAQYFNKGDKLHILAFKYISEYEFLRINYKPKIIYTIHNEGKNRIS